MQSGRLRRSARRPPRRNLHLRPGAQPGDVADRTHEPRDPRLSGEVKYTEGGSLLDDAFPTLKADFVIANPPFNQKEWSTPAILDDARWAHRSATRRQRQLRLDPALPVPPGAGWSRRVRHGQRVADDDDRWRGRDPGEPREGRRRRLHRRAARPAVLHHRHPCLPLVPRPRQDVGQRARPARRNAVHRCPAPGSKISRTQIELSDDEIATDRGYVSPLARDDGRRYIETNLGSAEREPRARSRRPNSRSPRAATSVRRSPRRMRSRSRNAWRLSSTSSPKILQPMNG